MFHILPKEIHFTRGKIGQLDLKEYYLHEVYELMIRTTVRNHCYQYDWIEYINLTHSPPEVSILA